MVPFSSLIALFAPQFLGLLQNSNQCYKFFFRYSIIIDTQPREVNPCLFLLRTALIAHSSLQIFTDHFGGGFPISGSGVLPVGFSDIRENTNQIIRQHLFEILRCLDLMLYKKSRHFPLEEKEGIMQKKEGVRKWEKHNEIMRKSIKCKR